MTDRVNATKAGPQPSGSAVSTFLGAVDEHFDAALKEARDLVEAKQRELREAKAVLAKLEAFQSARNNGHIPNSPELAGKYAEVETQILDLLKADNVGLYRRDFIMKLDARGDLDKQDSIIRVLASLKRRGRIEYDDSGYRSKV
jgi:hypothetical protein